jgi:hypothetical protein
VSDHHKIDLRSLALARAVSEKIDRDPTILNRVREWTAAQDAPAYIEWESILRNSWPEIRNALLDPSEEGKRLRQSSPFVGVLSPQERWEFFPVKSP